MFLRKVITLTAVFAAATVLLMAGETVTKTLHVSGNCNSCKKNIEKPLKSLDGVTSATWDKDTKQLTTTFDPTKVSEAQIKQAVLKAGYDADTLRAPDEAYAKLPKCCKYRTASHE